MRRLQGQDGDVGGEEAPATPKKIFQLLNQVTRFTLGNSELRLYVLSSWFRETVPLNPDKTFAVQS